MTSLFSPLDLPNGTALPNRIAKAAMEENMCDPGQLPGQSLFTLYERWAKGGTGLIISGNVMVSPDAMTGPGGVYLGLDSLEDPDTRARFETWAKAGKSGPGQFWLQISHPGRQVYASQGTQAVSASDTKVSMPGMEKMFPPARALSASEIKAIITRFADTALAAQTCGFDGVQIHAAHGYLISQFLSPLTNLRDDEWGGSLENRARFLFETIDAVKARCKKGFGLAIKLNSADFQRGGFDVDDAKKVVKWLNTKGLDFVELSGGSYESAAMMGTSSDGRVTQSASTQAREIYFLEFAKDIAAIAKMPIMVTGGVTKEETARRAVDEGVDLIGIAKALAYYPELPNDWQAGKNLEASLPVPKLKNPSFNALSKMAMTKDQLIRIGAGKNPNSGGVPALALVRGEMRRAKQTRRYKKWLAQYEA